MRFEPTTSVSRGLCSTTVVQVLPKEMNSQLFDKWTHCDALFKYFSWGTEWRFRRVATSWGCVIVRVWSKRYLTGGEFKQTIAPNRTIIACRHCTVSPLRQNILFLMEPMLVFSLLSGHTGCEALTRETCFLGFLRISVKHSKEIFSIGKIC